MSQQAPLDTGGLPASEQQVYEAPSPSLQRRRLAAARVRRRRLLVIDVCVGLTLALFGLIVAPGLAILALAALIALGACCAWIAGEHLLPRLRARRARRRAPGPTARRR